MQSCPPASDLAEYLSEFWQYDVAGEAHVPIQIYPSGVAVLRFDIGSSAVEASFYGPSLSPQMRGLFYRDVSVFGVALQATRTYSLFGISATELRDLRVQLDLMWPAQLDALKARLWATREFGLRVEVLSDFLRRVLRPERPDAAFLRPCATCAAVSPANARCDDSSHALWGSPPNKWPASFASSQ